MARATMAWYAVSAALTLAVCVVTAQSGAGIRNDKPLPLIWGQQYVLPNSGEIYSIAETSDGELVTCGFEVGADGAESYLRRLDDRNGNVLTAAGYGIASTFDICTALQWQDGRLWFIASAGSSYGVTTENAFPSTSLDTPVRALGLFHVDTKTLDLLDGEVYGDDYRQADNLHVIGSDRLLAGFHVATLDGQPASVSGDTAAGTQEYALSMIKVDGTASERANRLWSRTFGPATGETLVDSSPVVQVGGVAYLAATWDGPTCAIHRIDLTSGALGSHDMFAGPHRSLIEQDPATPSTLFVVCTHESSGLTTLSRIQSAPSTLFDPLPTPENVTLADQPMKVGAMITHATQRVLILAFVADHAVDPSFTSSGVLEFGLMFVDMDTLGVVKVQQWPAPGGNQNPLNLLLSKQTDDILYAVGSARGMMFATPSTMDPFVMKVYLGEESSGNKDLDLLIVLLIAVGGSILMAAIVGALLVGRRSSSSTAGDGTGGLEVSQRDGYGTMTSDKSGGSAASKKSKASSKSKRSWQTVDGTNVEVMAISDMVSVRSNATERSVVSVRSEQAPSFH